MNRAGRGEASRDGPDHPAVSPLRIFRTALLIFLGVVLLTGVPALAAWRALSTARVALVEADERGHVQLANRLLDKELFEIAGDLEVTRGATAIVDVASSPAASARRAAAGYLDRVANAYDRYPTIQLLDLAGRERLRVERAASGAAIAPPASLVDLADDRFVQTALELRSDEVHISRLAAAQHDGVTDSAPGAVMRLATPVLDAGGSTAGLLVFTFDASGLLADIYRAFEHAHEGHKPLFVQGDTLLYPPADAGAWGAAFAEAEGRSFSAAYPEAAAKVAAKPEGSLFTRQGLFVWSTTRPLTDRATRLESDTSEVAWTVVTHVEPEALKRARSLWGSSPWFLVVTGVSALLLLSFSVAIAIATERLRAARLRAQHDAMTDALTGAANRRAFQDAIVREIARSERYGATFALALLDIDHFKDINDRYGHDAGDQALRSLVALSRTVLRGSDEIFRIGGEEFAVLLPNTPLDDAEQVLERFRAALRAQPFPFSGDRPLELSVSIGLTASGHGRHSAHTMLTTADDALYQAKEEGRDRLVQVPLAP